MAIYGPETWVNSAVLPGPAQVCLDAPRKVVALCTADEAALAVVKCGLAVEARRAWVGVVHAAPVDANLPRHDLRRLGVALVAHAVDAHEAVDGVLREEESRMSDQMAAAGRLGRRTRD